MPAQAPAGWLKRGGTSHLSNPIKGKRATYNANDSRKRQDHAEPYHQPKRNMDFQRTRASRGLSGPQTEVGGKDPLPFAE